MRNLLRAAALIMTCFAAAPVAAQTSPVVVELYTSQGCSSCPPADELLAELSKRENVIALALHVDYWDYIGWADDFAIPSNTLRQQNYAHAAGHTTIYTPQFVVAGQDIVVGAKGMELADTVQARSEQPMPVTVDLARNGDQVMISASVAVAPADGPYVIQLVRYMEDQAVDISRGENAGRTITYSNIVSALETVQDWDGTAPLTVAADLSGATDVAVIVQKGANGPVVGAARLN